MNTKWKFYIFNIRNKNYKFKLISTNIKLKLFLNTKNIYYKLVLIN